MITPSPVAGHLFCAYVDHDASTSSAGRHHYFAEPHHDAQDTRSAHSLLASSGAACNKIPVTAYRFAARGRRGRDVAFFRDYVAPGRFHYIFAEPAPMWRRRAPPQGLPH